MLTTLSKIPLLVVLVLGWPMPVPAQTPARPHISLKVSPSRMIVPAAQLDRARDFTVTNLGRPSIDVVARTVGFTTVQGGDVRFSPDAPHSAAGWITLRPDRFRLAGGATRRVSVRIGVPGTADPGEHQVAVVFSALPPPGGKGIALSGSVGAPVYVTVPGEVVDSVALAGVRAPTFALHGPIELTASVRNVGTIRRDFLDKSRLQARVAGGNVPFPDFTLLRDGSQEVTTRWDDPPVWCLCRVKVSVPNPDGEPQTMETSIVILPLHLIGPAVGLAAALLLAWLMFRHRTRQRRSAISTNLSLAGGGHA